MCIYDPYAPLVSEYGDTRRIATTLDCGLKFTWTAKESMDLSTHVPP